VLGLAYLATLPLLGLADRGDLELLWPGLHEARRG
jgi:hypothetical protein